MKVSHMLFVCTVYVIYSGTTIARIWRVCVELKCLTYDLKCRALSILCLKHVCMLRFHGIQVKMELDIHVQCWQLLRCGLYPVEWWSYFNLSVTARYPLHFSIDNWTFAMYSGCEVYDARCKGCIYWLSDFVSLSGKCPSWVLRSWLNFLLFGWSVPNGSSNIHPIYLFGNTSPRGLVCLGLWFFVMPLGSKFSCRLWHLIWWNGFPLRGLVMMLMTWCASSYMQACSITELRREYRAITLYDLCTKCTLLH